MADVIVQERNVIVRSNGTQVVEPNPTGLGLDAMSKVTVTANVEDEHTILNTVVTENKVYTAPEGIAYGKVTVNVEPVTEDIDIVSNGTYTPAEGVDGYKKIVVDVPSDVNNQDKTVTENGVVTADLGFSGLGQVTVNVEPTEEQIAEFKAEGAEEQKAKLVTLDVTENGVYTKEDGYSRVTVDVQPTEEQKDEYREEGKAAQLTADKAAVASASPITANGTKSILDTEVIVNVPSDPEELQAKYDEGEAAGKAEQLSADKTAVAAISPIVENGTKTVLDTVITINVPDSEEGLAAAKAEGKAEQLTTDKAAVVAVSPITENGTKTILGESVVVNVPASEEELDAAKAEQAIADKNAVEAISPITSNGTKTVQLGNETASLTIDVEGGSSEYFDIVDMRTSSSSYKPYIDLPASLDPETCPLNNKTVRFLNVNGQDSSTMNLTEIHNGCKAKINFYCPNATGLPTGGFYGNTLVCKSLSSAQILGESRNISIKCNSIIGTRDESGSTTDVTVVDSCTFSSNGTITVHYTGDNPHYSRDNNVGPGTVIIDASRPLKYSVSGSQTIEKVIIDSPATGAILDISQNSNAINYLQCDTVIPITGPQWDGNYYFPVNISFPDFDWSDYTKSVRLASSVTYVGGFTGLTHSLNISLAKNLDVESLRNIINTIGEVTTTTTLKIASVHNDMLTEEEKAIAITKG